MNNPLDPRDAGKGTNGQNIPGKDSLDKNFTGADHRNVGDRVGDKVNEVTHHNRVEHPNEGGQHHASRVNHVENDHEAVRREPQVTHQRPEVSGNTQVPVEEKKSSFLPILLGLILLALVALGVWWLLHDKNEDDSAPKDATTSITETTEPSNPEPAQSSHPAQSSAPAGETAGATPSPAQGNASDAGAATPGHEQDGVPEVHDSMQPQPAAPAQ